jgi:hypothetical protein
MEWNRNLDRYQKKWADNLRDTDLAHYRALHFPPAAC